MTTVWVDGAFVGPDAPAIRPLDRGFLLGDGLFETMRAYGGHIFELDRHLARLEAGALRIGLPLPPDLEKAVLATLAESGLGDAAVRLTVSRGSADPGGGSEAVRPTVVVTAHPYAPDPRWYDAGIDATVVSGRVNEYGAATGLKQLGYLEPILAQAEARAAGADEAIRLDTDGHLAEGGMSNIFLVEGDVIRTPPPECGILRGITRATVIELAAERSLSVDTAPVPPAALGTATEIFVTSSLRELVPVTRLGGRPVAAGRPGPVTLALLAAYRERAGSAESAQTDR